MQSTGASGCEGAGISLEMRIACWQLQLQAERLTPLLQDEMQHAIKASSEALERPNLDADVDLVQNLDRLDDQITQHWCKVFQSPSFRAALLANMTHFELFLTAMLLEDYSAKSIYSPLPDEWFFDRAGQIKQHSAVVDGSGDDDDDDDDSREAYQESIVFPLEEMILNRAHVEARLCAAAAARQQQLSGSYVDRLIRGCEWETLAETLWYDRQLALSLFRHEPINPAWYWDADMLPKILQEMGLLEQKYFASLSSPTTYTISKHAADLFAGHSSISSGRAGPRPLSVSGAEKHAVQVSTADRIMRILNAVTDGIGLIGTGRTTRSRKDPATALAKADEKAPLADLR